MNIILVNPGISDNKPEEKGIAQSRSKKSDKPPLELLTIAALMPGDWKKRMLDLNTVKLRTRDLRNADYVFIYARPEQSDEADRLIDICLEMNKRIVAMGEHFTLNSEKYNHIDHLVLGETELTLPSFIEGYNNNWPHRAYRTNSYHDMEESPVPDYSLISTRRYSKLAIEYSRGGSTGNNKGSDSFHGKKIRTKTVSQVLLELDNIYCTGFRGEIIFTGNNFSSDRPQLKADLLPMIIKWNSIHKSPFSFSTVSTPDISEDTELISLMAEAGFSEVLLSDPAMAGKSRENGDRKLKLGQEIVNTIKKINENGVEFQAI